MWSGTHDFVGESLQPATHRRSLALSPDERMGDRFDQIGSTLPVTGAHSILHRLGDVSLLCVPLTGPQIQRVDLFCGNLLQTSAQRLSKEGMVAIPVSLTIERSNKEITSFQELQ